MTVKLLAIPPTYNHPPNGLLPTDYTLEGVGGARWGGGFFKDMWACLGC